MANGSFFHKIYEKISLIIHRDRKACLNDKIFRLYPYRFQDPDLLNQAFLHASAINPETQTRDDSYERLEFLGDAVLQLVVSRFLFFKFPDYSEGKLTQMRSKLVNRTTLAKVSTKLGFGDLLILGRGGEKDNLRTLHSVLSDLYESFTGALYLDGGFQLASDFINKTLLVNHHKYIPAQDTQNYKGRLYEYCQKNGLEEPVFKVVNENGPEHGKDFEISVIVNGEVYGTGIGKNKKTASQEAARFALGRIKEEKNRPSV
jgi:ribonuclease III